jgi:hypothetical protein
LDQLACVRFASAARRWARLKLIANGFVGVRGATIVVAGIRKPSQ